MLHTAGGSPLTLTQQAAIADRIARAHQVDGIESVLDPFEAEAQREDPVGARRGGRLTP